MRQTTKLDEQWAEDHATPNAEHLINVVALARFALLPKLEELSRLREANAVTEQAGSGRSVVVVTSGGVVAAGAAYVPLDAVYPTARLEAMLEDSRAKCVIGNAALTSTRIPSMSALHLETVASEGEAPVLSDALSPTDRWFG